MADSKSGRKRGVALLLVGMVLGAALITPAGAHVTSVTHSWKKHFLPLAKKAFYTKTQSNARYLGKTAKAADAVHADSADTATTAGHAGEADRLDGIDSPAFGRPIAWGTETLSQTLTSGHNYSLGTAFTPAESGKCLVTVSSQIDGANTGVGPFFRVALKRGASAPTEDGFWGHYFLAGLGNRSEDLSRTSVVAVNAGETIQLGAFFGGAGGDWVGDTAETHLTYQCTTPGSSTVGVSSVSRAAAEAAAQQ